MANLSMTLAYEWAIAGDLIDKLGKRHARRIHAVGAFVG